MTLDELHEALLQWGRWARDGEPRIVCPISPVFREWIPSQWWKDAGEEAPAGVDVLEAEPNEHECYALEKVICGLQRRHRNWLVCRYVREQYVHWDVLGAAQRALLDRVANPQRDAKENKSNAGLPECVLPS